MAASGSNSNNGLGDTQPFLGLIKNSEIGGDGEKLPSYGEVLSFFLFHLNRKLNHGEIADITSERLILIYEEPEIPHIEPKSVVKELKKLFTSYADLKKRSLARSNAQLDRELRFEENFDDLFDISPKDALQRKEVPENVKKFLELQRMKGRPGNMTVFNVGRRKRIGVTTRPEQFDQDVEVPPSTSRVESSRSDSGSPMEIEKDDDDEQKDPSYVVKEKKSAQHATTTTKRKPLKKDVIGPRVVSVLDRYKFHSRGVTH